jgi:hypothetical protein
MNEQAEMTCPACGGSVPREARRCRHCGEDLRASGEQIAMSAFRVLALLGAVVCALLAATLSPGFWIGAAACVALGIVVRRVR